ncbi:set domain-containing protein [Cyclospora cayetanensis]|uniref:[histone H3]-lysine(4) N-trimethyltransferase n=1 Tax=Cyclospora cayetanensis TaxID=88456 RepID=A0A1D3CZW5_9EIME|nr:set domain-containing protein [Cyclospora cayetanensis]
MRRLSWYEALCLVPQRLCSLPIEDCSLAAAASARQAANHEGSFPQEEVLHLLALVLPPMGGSLLPADRLERVVLGPKSDSAHPHISRLLGFACRAMPRSLNTLTLALQQPPAAAWKLREFLTVHTRPLVLDLLLPKFSVTNEAEEAAMEEAARGGEGRRLSSEVRALLEYISHRIECTNWGNPVCGGLQTPARTERSEAITEWMLQYRVFEFLSTALLEFLKAWEEVEVSVPDDGQAHHETVEDRVGEAIPLESAAGGEADVDAGLLAAVCMKHPSVLRECLAFGGLPRGCDDTQTGGGASDPGSSRGRVRGSAAEEEPVPWRSVDLFAWSLLDENGASAEVSLEQRLSKTSARKKAAPRATSPADSPVSRGTNVGLPATTKHTAAPSEAASCPVLDVAAGEAQHRRISPFFGLVLEESGCLPEPADLQQRRNELFFLFDAMDRLKTAQIHESSLKATQLAARQKQLRIAKSAVHGWGVFAAETIRRGEFIVEYAGNAVSEAKANFLEAQYVQSMGGSTYFFKLRDGSIVDATTCGSVTRFINHSCAPNCCTVDILDEDEEDGGSHVGLIALRDIAIGEELSYNYRGSTNFTGYRTVLCKGTADNTCATLYGERLMHYWPQESGGRRAAGGRFMVTVLHMTLQMGLGMAYTPVPHVRSQVALNKHLYIMFYALRAL